MREDSHWLALPAAVARFLHDPLEVPAREPAVHRVEGATDPAELMGAHLPDALAAQAHALAGRHREAREAMQRALALLESAATDPSQTPAERLHLRTLSALALGFIAREALLEHPAGASGEGDMAEALRRRPDLSYLWRLQAERSARLSRIVEAIEALDRADALGLPAQGLLNATLAAAWVLEEEPIDLGRLQRVERRFFNARRPHEPGEGERGLSEFWHGRLLLAMAEASGGVDAAEAGGSPDAVHQLARRALAQLRQAELLLTGEGAKTAASWAEQARRRLPADEPAEPLEHAMLALRLERADAAAAARALPRDVRPGWRGVAQAIAQCPAASHDGSSAIDLLVPVLRDLRRAEPRRIPLPQRIKLAVPTSLAPDDAAMRQVIGDGQRSPTPSITRLREEILRRYGVELPGVHLRGDSPIVSLSVDGVRVATYLVPPWPQRLRIGRRGRPTVEAGRRPDEDWLESGLDWFGLAAWLEPESDEIGKGLAGGLLASVFASVHLVRYLDRFIGTRDLARLELRVVRPGPVLTMLRLLAADRTPLVAAELDEPTRLVDSRALPPLEGVQAYRARPAIQRRLWGARDRHRGERDLDDAPRDLAARLRAALPAADVPDRIAGLSAMLVDELVAWAEACLDERSCVLVGDPALQPWLRALLRPRWPDVPVLTKEERSAGLRPADLLGSAPGTDGA